MPVTGNKNKDISNSNSNSNFDSDSDSDRDRDPAAELKKVAKCIKKVANISEVKPYMMMDTKTFNPELLSVTYKHASTKLKALMENIKELDNKDIKKHGHVFKHMIFTDSTSSKHGGKLIASVLASENLTPVFQNNIGNLSLKSNEELLKTKGSNFALLLSKPFYDKSMSVKFRKATMEKFNERPTNAHGDLIRFIVVDQGFKEGIDLYDLKYVHLFEPFIIRADEKQAIGRGTRFCGQKGLVFHPRFGWPLYVFKYDASIPKGLLTNHQHLDAKSMFELLLKYTNIDLARVMFAAELERISAVGAVDAILTEPIHTFSIAHPSPIRIQNQSPTSPKSPKSPKPIKDKETEETEDKETKDKKGGAVILDPTPPRTIMSHTAMKSYISRRFSKFQYPRASLTNNCIDPKAEEEDEKEHSGKNKYVGKNQFVDYTPTQDFIRHYFQPESAYKGMLIYNSVGTGKSCTGIATASSSFEKQGYTILWVTRHTLKADIWKNMFKQICSEVVKDSIVSGKMKLPKKVAGPMKYVSKNWIEPISYKQFSNMLLEKNKYYTDIVNRNGKKDPLRKTLVIIDEAHKLYSKSVAASERPRVDILEKMIQNSYKVSGKDSARVILMTATPYTEDPMEMLQLLNLLRPQSQKLPTEFPIFNKKYLNADGFFTKKGEKAFLDSISGYISYVNRSGDARNFAYPVVENITTPLTTYDKDELTPAKKRIEEARKLQEHIRETKIQINELKPDVKARVKAIKTECKTVASINNKKCKEEVVEKYQVAVDKAKNKKTTQLTKCKNEGKKQDCKDKVKEVFQKAIESAKADKKKMSIDCVENKKIKACDKPEVKKDIEEAETKIQERLDTIQELKSKKLALIPSDFAEKKDEFKSAATRAKALKPELKDAHTEYKRINSVCKEIREKLKQYKLMKNTEKVAEFKTLLAKENEKKKEIKVDYVHLKQTHMNLENKKKLLKLQMGTKRIGDVSQEKALVKKCLS